MKKEKLFNTRSIAVIGVLGALSGLLMLVLEVPLLFVAPEFYKLDFSEVPVLIGTFALGPAAGVVIEIVKLLIKLMFRPSTTGYVGELANLIIGCAMLLPAGLIYQAKKTKKRAMAGLAAGTVSMVAAGTAVNALVLLPFYGTVMPMDKIIAAGSAIFPAVHSVWTFALWCVAPFNLIKGAVISLLTALLYKRISRVIKEFGRKKE